MKSRYDLIHRFEDRVFLYAMLGIPFLVIFLLVLYPLVYSVQSSFLRLFIHRPDDASFVGIENYIRATTDTRLLNTIKITFLYTLFSTVFSVVFGLFLALLLNTTVYSKTIKARNLIRSLLLVPFIMSQAVSGAIMASHFFGRRLGIINYALASIGFAPFNWFGNSTTALFAVVVTDVWRTSPLVMLLFDAALRSIPKTYFEAARIDGASRLRIFRSITLSLLVPQLVIVLILRITASWRQFDLIFLMTHGGPGRATETFSLYIYLFFMRYLEFGYASALSWIMVATLALLCGTLIWLLRRKGTAMHFDK